MIDYKYKNLFTDVNSVNKNIIITTDDGIYIDNDTINGSDFTLTESLCSENQIKFGCCEVSSVEFRVSEIVQSLIGKVITVKMILEGGEDEPFVIGKYKVDSDKPTADRAWRDVVAYDCMYDIVNTNVIEWYIGLTFPIKLKDLRDSFFRYVGVSQKTVTLCNDNIMVQKVIDVSSENAEFSQQLTGMEVLKAICEVNGVFGHIKNGVFNYVQLEPYSIALLPSNTLYPSDTLYPRDFSKNSTNLNGIYENGSLIYEDFLTDKITGIKIIQSEGDSGIIYGSENNIYTISPNIITNGQAESELKTIAKRMLNTISGVSYRPFTAKAQGNLCVEVGDPLHFNTDKQMIVSYCLRRKMNGVIALFDEYSSEGTKHIENDGNSTQSQILSLQGKSNLLSRTLEETKSEIKDDMQGLSTRIVQNANNIALEASRASTAEGNLSSRISITADAITQEVSRSKGAEEQLSTKITQTADNIMLEANRASKAEGELSSGIIINSNAITSEVKRSTNAETALSSRITQTAESITSEVQRATSSESSLSSRITQTAESITSEVKRAKNSEDSLSSRITQTSDSITSEVSRATSAEGKLSSVITQTASGINAKISADGIATTIEATARAISFSTGKIKINSKNFILDENGNATFSGKVKGASIESSSIYAGGSSGYSFSINGNTGELRATNAVLSGLFVNEGVKLFNESHDTPYIDFSKMSDNPLSGGYNARIINDVAGGINIQCVEDLCRINGNRIVTDAYLNEKSYTTSSDVQDWVYSLDYMTSTNVHAYVTQQKYINEQELSKTVAALHSWVENNFVKK